MAQIIKHRRGQLSGVKSLTARNAEFIIASGSISDLNGPFVFIGSPNGTDEGVAGAFKSVSTIYQGTTAPTITAGSYGSILDGTPFYASGNESLYILNNDGAGGNSRLDLTGNIEGNLISGVTINNITGTTANIKNISGSFTGSGIGLYDIPASGITGLELNRISSGLATASISELGGLRVNVKTEITGALIVTGNITGSNMYLSGNSKIDGNITGSNMYLTGSANIGGNITGSNMYLTGSTKIDGNITGSNMYLTGDAKIDGNITLGGNITVGDSNTDFVTFGAEISSSIVPDIHNAFDLGSSDKNWRDLHVSGTAYVDTLQARQVNFNDLGVLTDLHVSGSTYLGNGGDVTVVSGSLYNDQLTNNRVVIAGVRGVLEDDANFTFDGTKLNVGVGSFEVDTDGDIRTSGSLIVTSTSQFKDAVGVNSTLDVTGSATLKSTLEVKGATGLNSTLNVTGSATLKSTLEVKGATGLNSTLDVTGSATLKSTLQVNSSSELRGAVGMNSSLDVTGSAQFKSTINVDGVATVSSSVVEDLTQYRIVGVGSGGSLIDYSGLTYNGTKLQIGGGKLEIDNASGDIRTSGSLTVNSGMTINGDETVNGILTVTGNTQLGGNLYVSGNLEVLGSSTAIHLQSNTVEIDDNIIRLNAYSPFQRYAGIEVIDSGSSGISASMVWDSQNDYWMFVSGSGQSSKFIGTTYGTYGSETSLTSGTFPIASGTNTIGDSLLTYSGTTLAFNTNKFTIDSGNGNTMVSGNFTLSYSGGTDNGSKTSGILFRNSSNVVGFVTTTETTDVMDGILGYKHSDGGLVFSTVIDGGTY
jgi:hypothetical protein